MIGVIDVSINAANPQMPLYPVRAFKNSPSSIRLRNVPRKIGNWKITSVQIVAIYPDNSIRVGNCVLVGGVWVGTIEGCPISGRSENGFTVFASGIDENGNPVSNYVLGKGLIEILEGDGTITPDAPSYYVHLYDEEPTTPKEGDMYPTSDGYAIWQDGQANLIGFAPNENQLAAINSVVDERKTVFTIYGFPYYDVEVDVVGELNSSHLPVEKYLIRDVKIGTAVTSIADNTFSQAPVGPLTIPNTVKQIGNHAFEDCHELRGTLVIPDGVETIGEYAFMEANSLDTIEVPSSVKTIGRNAFLASAPRIIFKGRTIEEVRAMQNYPWGNDEAFPELDNTNRVTVYATEKDLPVVPSNVSEFNNDAGYITASAVSASYATKEDATLYLRGTNKDGFSDWTVYNTGDLTWTLNYVPQQSGWILQTFDGEGHSADTVLCVAPEDATYLDLSGIGGTLPYYATREHLYGYTLGSQDDKVIASPSYVESYVQTYVDAQIGTLLSTAF